MMSFIGRSFAILVLLPIFRITTVMRLKSARLAVPARSLMIYAATNRYLFHAVVVLITAATVTINFVGTRANAQDVGQASLLYAIVTGGTSYSTEEIVHSDTQELMRYTGDDTIVAIPDIDFNYDEAVQPPRFVQSIPGTIVANLIAHTPDSPEGPSEERREVETYVVKEGDTMSVIAQRFGVNIGTILWANDRSATQYIRPGDTLRIPPVSGVLVKVSSGDTLGSLAKKYSANLREIVEFNRLDPDAPLPTGVELVLPGGEPPYTPPAQVIRKPTVESLTIPGNQFVSKPPDANPTNAPGGKLLWPTSGRVITQYYGWRHTGLDIDGHYDSPLYASHDGTVTTAGWNSGGYGLQVVINGAGVMTRYAHASKIFVKAGDEVVKGQVIAMMGTTGRSTGTHLHYEVYINGSRVNPLAYIR